MADSTFGYPEPSGYEADVVVNPDTVGDPLKPSQFAAPPGGSAPPSVTGGDVDVRPRKRDLRMNKRFTLTQGTPYSDDLGFNARSLIVDNHTGQWLYDAASRRYIPPSTFGVVLQFPSGSQIGSLSWVAPPGVTQPAGVTGAQAVVIYTEDLLDPSAGIDDAAHVGVGSGSGIGAAGVLGNGVTVVAAGSTTIITVPAGRTWVGTIGVSTTAQNPPVTATGSVSCRISTVGAGVTPPSSVPYVAADVELAATITGSLLGEQANGTAVTPNFIVVAPAGNSVTLSLDVATAGVVTALQCRGWAIGVLQ